MVLIILIIFVLLSFAMDYYIMRRYLARANPWRRVYIIQSVVLNPMILLMLFFHSALTSSSDDSSAVIAMLWIIWSFMLLFMPKLVFVILSLIELTINKLAHAKIHSITTLGLVAAFVTMTSMIYGATLGRHNLRVERIEIRSAEIPAGFDGFTIAHFSDVHLGNLGAENPLIINLVDTINHLNPNLIVSSGDLVNIHSRELTPRFIAQFTGLRAPVLSVLGNHDLGFYLRDSAFSAGESLAELISKQEAMGWTLLRNQTTTIHHNGDSITLAGVNYIRDTRLGLHDSGLAYSDLRNTMRDVADSSFSILISHSPAIFDSIPHVAHADLTISGHVHSMQAKITIGSWSWSPASWLFRHWSGFWVNETGEKLYVNDGLGYVLYPMRIGTRPEVTFYTLRRSL